MPQKPITPEQLKQENEKFMHPDSECDLVMKGGITSGVVYPPAISLLATKYRFCSIGGTSAGAIAAAVAAAAEYGRETAGFAKLGHAQERLGERGFIADTLFQVPELMQPIKKTLLAIVEGREKSRSADLNSEQSRGVDFRHPGVLWQCALLLQRALRNNGSTAYRRGATGGFVVGIFLAVASALVLFVLGVLTNLPFSWLPLVLYMLLFALLLGTALSVIGGMIWGVYTLGRSVLTDLPNNNYGLCMGHQKDQHSEQLTDWLSNQIDWIAGHNMGPPDYTPSDNPDKKARGKRGPLTFGDLKAKGIILKMMATDVSHGQPYVFPMTKDDIQTIFVFDAEAWTLLFPERIIDHMKTVMVQYAKDNGITLPPCCYLLPVMDDMPVAVAVRMSLSAPLLISAVPLSAVKAGRWKKAQDNPGLSETTIGPDDLQPCWLSDGGICSNFPIHFFDAWLPLRPTFGINLTYSSTPEEHSATWQGKKSGFSPGTPGRAGDPPANKTSAKDKPDQVPPVYLLKPDDPVSPAYNGINGLLAFCLSIFDTALNYRDNMQVQLPSYRERVVQIRFGPGEGGINLVMTPETIAHIAAKGIVAATKLLPVTGEFDFHHHYWVRLRVLMALLETQMEGLQISLASPDLTTVLGLVGTGKLPYDMKADWGTSAKVDYLKAMQDLIDAWTHADKQWREGHIEWGEERFFAYHSPQPRPVLRVTPDI